MDRPASRLSLSSLLIASSLLPSAFFAAPVDSRAQTPGQLESPNSQSGAATPPSGANRRGATPADGAVRGAGRPHNEPSQAYRESIRRTVEIRRQRRANRGHGMGETRPIGGIVPWPIPPALIIRHTPQVHDEIDSLLGLLRK
jgi:hypothetical protein